MSSKCPTCGREDFSSRRTMKIHHAQSHGEKIDDSVECPVCGEDFYRPPSEIKNDHPTCSKECAYKLRSQKGHVEVKCSNCEKLFDRHKYRVERNQHNFCDQQCKGEFYSQEDHPRWTGGRSRFFDTSSGEAWVRAVMERDENECQDCGSTENLVAHHIKRRDECSHFEKYAVWNGVTLCQECHAERHEGEDVYEMLKWIAEQ